MFSSEYDDLGLFNHKRNITCSRKLLDALRLNHEAVCVVPEREPEPEPLPPIPNELMAYASDLVAPPASGQIRRIQLAVLQDHPKLALNDLLSNRRTKAVVWPRQVGMYLAKTLTRRSLPEIGRRFGGRDHTTVIHAIRKVEKLLETDPAVAAHIERVKGRLGDFA